MSNKIYAKILDVHPINAIKNIGEIYTKSKFK